MSETEFDPDEYDLTIERTLDAPRERVWKAWTDPEQVARWWGPEGFTVPRCEMDVRPGGAFRIDMEAPDGTVYPSEGAFDEVDEPDRLVLIGRAVEDGDGDYQLEVRQTVTFEEQNGRTELTLEAEVVSATLGAADALDGMEAGWSQSLEKLEEYVEPRPTNDDTDVETTDTRLTIRRTFDASPERLWRAFTDPDELAQWYAPGDMTAEIHTWETTPNGELDISMVDEEGSHDAEGTFEEVVANERLVHTWQWTHIDEPVETVVTVEFLEVEDGTEVVLTHEGHPDVETVEEHVSGWSGVLANLAGAL